MDFLVRVRGITLYVLKSVRPETNGKNVMKNGETGMKLEIVSLCIWSKRKKCALLESTEELKRMW